jgi:membrane-associated phospholipid phosphatase
LFNFPSGHTTGATWTLPFGVDVEVAGGSMPRLTILEAAVD